MLKKIKEITQTQLELLCEVGLEEMIPYLNKAANKISQKIKISGFRPGKAPYEIIKKTVGEMEIYQEALDKIISQDYFEIINKEKLKVIDQPKIDIQILVPGQPIVYKAIVDLLPKVKLCDYKNIKIKKPKIKIDPKKIDEIVKKLQKSKAKEVLVNRKIKKEDKVKIDIEMFDNKIPLEDGQIKNHLIIVGEPFFIPGFNENLIGLEQKDEKEFELKMPENYFNKNLANKIINFKIKINSVYQMDLPELNDEFAKSLGEFKTFKDLLKQLEKNLEIEEKLKIDEKFENEIFEQIMNKSNFEEISDNLIKMETEKMFLELEQEIVNQGIKIKDYLNHLKKTEEDFKKEFQPLAIKRIRSILIIQEIIKNENLEVSEEEIAEQINNLLKVYSTDKEIQERFQSENYKKYLKGELINKKAIEFLKKTCAI
jgi:trigger factor